MTRTRRNSALFLLVVTLNVAVVGAEEPQPEYRSPLPEQQAFTAAEAVAYGLIHNPDLMARRSLIGVAEGDVISAAILADTEISVAVEHERDREKSPGERHSITNTRSWSYDAAQGIGIAAQRPYEILAARAELDAARLDVAEGEIELVHDIKYAVIDYLAATVEDAKIDRVIFEAKPPMWTATEGKPSDRRRALAAFLYRQASFPEDARARLDAETKLDQLLGLPAGTRFFIAGDLEPVAAPLTYDDLKQSIMSRNIPLQSALVSLRAARIGLELAMRGKVPDVAGDHAYQRAHSTGHVGSSATVNGLSVAPDIFRQFVEQNRGEIRAAKSAVKAAEQQVTATRWDVESELFQLCSDLELARSQIVVFKHGFLPQQEKILLEQDPEDYKEGKISFDTWTRDWDFYHQGGDDITSLKIEYAQALADLELLIGGSFSSPVKTQLETTALEGRPANYLAGASLKLGRGLGSILLSPIEIPAGWYGYARERGAWGVVFGLYEGLVTTVTRAAGGVLDVATAPIPWPVEGMKPVSLPILDENPWSGSWSLRYVHPAYNHRYVPANEQIQSANGGK